MEEHLIPAGFVEEKERENERGSGYKERRQFRLTAAGASWLEEHEEEVAVPKSRPETQQMALEALQEASSAKDSVQSYRQKLNRIKQKAEDVEDEWEEWQSDKRSEFSTLYVRTTDLMDDSEEHSRLIEKVESDVSHIEAQREEFVQNVGYRLGEQEETIAELRGENAELRESLEKLRKDVDAILEEMNRGRVDRLRQRFGDD